MTDARSARLDDVEDPDFSDPATFDDSEEVQPNAVDMVVFDIGNVLVHWNPAAAIAPTLGEEAAQAYLSDEGVAFHARNVEADAGRPWPEIIAEIERDHPAHQAAAQAYVDNFGDAIAEPIRGTVEILEELHAAEVPLFAVTNFNADLFRIAQERHRFLDLFEEIIVSGEEGVAKPNPEMWEILEEVTRHVGNLDDAVFIDDSDANVMSAEAAGMDAIRFTDPQTLRSELLLRGLPLRAGGTAH